MEYLIIALILGILAMFLFAFIFPIVFTVRAGKRAESRRKKAILWLVASAITAGESWLLGKALEYLFTPIKAAAGLSYALCAVLILLWLMIVFRLMKNKSAWLAMFFVCTISFSISGVFFTAGLNEQKVPLVKENSGDIWRDYNPLVKETILAMLDGRSTLRITEDIPRLDGATALYPVYAAFANAVYPMENYAYPEDFDPFTDIENAPPPNPLELSTTALAYEKLVDGETDVIFVAAPSEEQLQYAADNGEEMVFTPIGREAFVFFVNAKNPIDSMTVDQLRGVYSGELTRWEEIDPALDLGKIRAYQRNEGSGSQSSMIRFMGDVPLMDAPRTQIVASMGGIIDTVASYRNHENAIGYSFRFYSTEMVQNNQIKHLQINGIAPTKENILNGAYPISSEFYAVHLASNDNPNIPLLLEWILSEQGQSLIDKTGYVAVR